MSSPDYVAPTSLTAALQIKQEQGAKARIIAGGTDLILRMRDHVYAPELLIDLRQLGLNAVKSEATQIRLGAALTLSNILDNPQLASLFPALLAACRPFAGPPIRNRGTLGGNIVNGSPAGDLLPPLIAYDADLVLASADGERILPLTEFFVGPGQTRLRDEEILTEVRLPMPPPTTAATFTKLGQRRSMAISIVNVSTRLTLAKNGVISAARIVLGSVAPTPQRVLTAEGLLVGNIISDDLINQAAASARQEVSPISDVRASEHYRLAMVEVLVRRALTEAWDLLRQEDANV